MKIERLHELMDEHPDGIEWVGKCHDCRHEVTVTADAKEDGIHIAGGGVYETAPGRIYLKCEKCLRKKLMLTGYQECEVYARIVGYLRPVKQWNPGKQAEFDDRKMFDQPEMVTDIEPDDYLLMNEK